MQEAVAAFQQAMDSAEPKIAPAAALTPAVFLEDIGDLEEAQRAYEQAAASGRPRLQSNGCISLGNLLAEQKETSRELGRLISRRSTLRILYTRMKPCAACKISASKA